MKLDSNLMQIKFSNKLDETMIKKINSEEVVQEEEMKKQRKRKIRRLTSSIM